MDKKSKLFIVFAAGALVGAGIAALFTTEKGKKIVDKAKGKIDDLSEDVKGKIKNFENEVSDLLKGNDKTENPSA
jgi:gas vesicle protein